MQDSKASLTMSVVAVAFAICAIAVSFSNGSISSASGNDAGEALESDVDRPRPCTLVLHNQINEDEGGVDYYGIEVTGFTLDGKLLLSESKDTAIEFGSIHVAQVEMPGQHILGIVLDESTYSTSDRELVKAALKAQILRTVDLKPGMSTVIELKSKSIPVPKED